jgi:hypothetical protein
MERALEMTRRQAALPRYFRERHTTKVGTDNLLRASLLPWREQSTSRQRCCHKTCHLFMMPSLPDDALKIVARGAAKEDQAAAA